MIFLPPTTDLPPDPEPLSREDLNSVYLELRNCYKSSMISRGQFRSRSIKARDETSPQAGAAEPPPEEPTPPVQWTAETDLHAQRILRLERRRSDGPAPLR